MPVVLGLAALEDTVVAFFLLLFIVATYPIWKGALVAVLSELPLVGGWAASNADRLATALYGWANGWVATGLGAVSRLVDTVQADALALAQETTRAAFWTHDRLSWVVQSYVPSLVGVLRTEVYTEYGWLLGGIAQALASAQAFALAQVGVLRAEVYTEYGWLLGGIAQARTEAEAFAQAGIDRLAGQVGQALRGLQGELTQDLSRLSGELVAELTRLRDLIRATAQELLAELGRAISAERAHADQVGAEAHSYTDAQTAAIAATAAAAVAAVATAVKAIEDSPCQQRCSTLGNLGGELEALELGLLLAGLAVLVREPKPAADAVVRTLAPDFQAAVRTLAGVVRAA